MSLGLVALLALGVQAQDLPDQPGAKSEVTLRLEQVSAQPGDTVWAGLHLVIPAPWHTYWVNHGGVGEAPSVKWQLPRGVTAGKIHWPLPKKHKSFGSIAYVYEREALLLLPLKLAKDLKPGQREIKAVVKWLECTDESCVQGEKRVSAKFGVGGGRVAGGDAALFTKWRAQLPGVMPDLKADWAGPVADNFWRPLAFRVPLKDADDKVEFYPYLDPNDEFTVQADVEVERGKSFVKLTQQVESVGKKWPAQVPGVLRVGDKGYELVLKVGAKENQPEKVPKAKQPEADAKTRVTLVLDAEQAQLGGAVLAGVHFTIPDPWHIFWKRPGGGALKPEIKWQLPKGVTAGEIQWPKHEKYKAPGVVQNVYHKEVMLIVPLTLANNLKSGGLDIKADVEWQQCTDKLCVPGEAKVQAVLMVGDGRKDSAAVKEIAAWQAKVPVSGGEYAAVDWSQLGGMLLLAFAGGLILNLMPCVLPVIALKVMGFVNQRKEEPGHARRLGIIYGLGVIFSFLIMAGLLLSVRASAGGETWGMQMQNKWFLLFLTVLMTLVALNLFGVFEITLGGSTMTKADAVARKEGTLGAFANGMLMVALATPCLAPMLGTAIGFALTQPALVVVLMFATVAVGLALPYVVLSFKPDWLRFLPQPGAWMESFKKSMGFPMLAAAIWLSTLAAGKLGEGGGLRVGLLMVSVALAVWIFGEFIQRGTSRRGLAGFFALAASGAAVACLFVFQDKLDWKQWSEAAVAEVRAARHPVLVDFTADWCLTCKLNKRSSIEVDSVRKKIESTGTVVFKGDFTDKNPGMAAFIKSHGRPGVPLVLVYSPDTETKPQILPELLRPGLVLAALEKAATNVPTDISWGEWSAESVVKAQAKGMPVLVDFTADWCAPCKHIEKTAINVPSVRKKLAQFNVVTLKADFTDKSKVIENEMHRFGRPGPPLVLLYPPKEPAKPIVMPQAFTSIDLLKALDQAVGEKTGTQKGLESTEASATPRR